MGDNNSAGVFGTLLDYLARDFDRQTIEVQTDRKIIAKKFRKYFREFDFNDDDLDAYDQLLTLGLAKKCKFCFRAYTEWSKDDHDGNCTD